MKFGDTLQQRSVPRWKRQNFDYSSVKSLIKEITTPGHGKAISIPGQGDAVAEVSAEALYGVLVKEHDRVGLFVKSKVYEVCSRLDSIARQLDIISGPRSQDQLRRNTISIRRKLSKVESEILSVGEEIQDLSRFVAINRLAIHKLLKKYRKWTGSTNLKLRMNEVVKKDTSFTRTQLTQSVNRYTTYLDAVRSPYGKQSKILCSSPLKSSSPDSDSLFPYNTYQSLEESFSGSGVEFDTALATAPRRKSSRTSKYWVHADNVVELRILLLQHLRYASIAPEDVIISSSPTKSSKDEQPRIEKSDEVGCVVLDSLSHFSQARHSMVRSSSSNKSLESYGTVLARWASNGDMAAVIPGHPSTAVSFHKSQLHRILESTGPRTSQDSNEFVSLSADQHRLRDYLNSVEDIETLAFACSSRSRFVGLDNTSTNAAWAALDEDVEIGQLSPSDLRNIESLRTLKDPRVSFPHAVLTARTEGEGSYLLDVLDKSHLTERVDEFCLAVHAVALCRRPATVSEPSWVSLINNDIRHIPRDDRPSSAKSSTRVESSGSGTTKYISQSNTTPSEPSLPFRKHQPQSHMRGASRKLHPLITSPEPKAPEQTRYWNEYDDPEDGNGDDAFYVYVDPNAPVFPGQHTLSRIGRRFMRLFKKGDHTTDAEHGRPTEDTSLLPPGLTTPKDISALDSPTSSSSSSSDDHHPKPAYGSTTSRPLFPSYTSTPHSTTRTHTHARSRSIALPSAPHTQPPPSLRLSLIALAASLLILVVSAGLSSTARHKYRSRVDVFVVIGAAASIAFAALGLAHMFTWSAPARGAALRASLGLDYLAADAQAAGVWRLPRTAAGSWTSASVGVAAVVLVGVDIWLLARTIS